MTVVFGGEGTASVSTACPEGLSIFFSRSPADRFMNRELVVEFTSRAYHVFDNKCLTQCTGRRQV